jgi:AraC-like DNA-binding protein
MIYSFDELSFQILTVGHFFHRNGVYDVKPRPFAAFSFRISGTADFEIDNKHFTSSAGDILFLPANMGYKVKYSSGESIVVHFSDCNYTTAEGFSPTNPAKIEIMFQNLLKYWNETSSANLAKSKIYEIIYQLSIEQKSSTPSAELAKCIQYLEEHAYDSNLKIEDICHQGFMSMSSMYRAFYNCFGMSAKAYLNKLRMTRALSLLAKNTHSVLYISELCGFSDAKYFSKAFKKAYGYPPSQFKNNMKM